MSQICDELDRDLAMMQAAGHRKTLVHNHTLRRLIDIARREAEGKKRAAQ